MPKRPVRNLKNATITLPKSVYVAARRRAAERDQSFSKYVADLLSRETAGPADDGLTPGQRLAALSRKIKPRDVEPLVIDKAKLMERK